MTQLIPVTDVKPLDQMTDAELLADTARLSLLRVRRTIERERAPDDLKGERLAVEMAMDVVKVFARVQGAQLRGQRSDNLLEVLKAIAEFER
jgi:hypothetical protein